MASNRIQHIDRLKGLAIILVVIGHLIKTGENGLLYQFIYSFHMPLFMFLSGIVIKQIPSFRKLLVKLSHFLFPFIVVGICYSLFIGHTIDEYFFAEKKMGYWYLLVLAQFYFFISIHNILGKQNVIKDIVFFLFIYVFLYVACSYFPANLVEILSLRVSYQQWPFFCLGFLFGKYNIPTLFINNHIVGLIVIALIVYIPAYYIWSHYGHLFILQAICVIFLIYTLFMKRENSKTYVEDKLSILGRNTLDIYIYHSFFITLFSLKEINLYLENSSCILLEFALCLLVSVPIIFLSIIISNLIRKSVVLKKIVYGF